MLWTPGNTEDIERYYLHTYVKFPQLGDRLYKIAKFDARDGINIVVAVDENNEEVEIELHEDQPYFMQSYMPHRACFEHNGCVHHLARKPARQYRRGLCQDNIALHRLNPNGIWKVPGLDFATLKAYVGKTQLTPIDEALEAGMTSVCLSRRFSVSLSAGFVYIDTQLIGERLDGSFTNKDVVLKVHPQFKDTVAKLLSGYVKEVK